MVGIGIIIGFFAFLGTGELFMLRPGCIVIADAGSEAVITLTNTEVWLVAKNPHMNRIVLGSPLQPWP